MKIAQRIPVHKKEDQTLFNNYRPISISILPVLSKILEKVMHKHLYKYLNDRNIFFPRQFGFHKNHSTIDAVTQFATEALTCMDKKEYLVGIFLDLSKALDTITYSVNWKNTVYVDTLSWFESYLSGWKQFVNYNGTKSSLYDVLCGVPYSQMTQISMLPIITLILFAMK